MSIPWRAKLGLAIGLALAGGPLGADARPSGVAIAVIQSAEASGETGQRMLQVEAPVYSGDEIVTGAVGEAQIRFRDDTRLVVGPKSKLVIDAFVFRNDNTARDISINAIQGAFRFISGNSRKDAYRITTPTATIGVRGTEIDISVDARATRTAFISGAGRICQRGTVTDGSPERPSCVEVVGNCSLTVIQPGRSPRKITSIPDRNRDLNWYFRYLRNQASLREEFRVDTSRCGLAQVQPPRSSSPPPPPPSPAVQQEEEPPPPPPEGGKNNNGFGNGGDTASEGPNEQTNPGKGGGNNGNNGNGKNK